MPEKNIKRRTTQKARVRSDFRKNKQNPGCEGCHGTSEGAPKIIANSIFALTLSPRKAFDVKDNISVFEKPVNDIANDLLHSLNRSLFLLKKPKLKLPAGISRADKMNLIIDKLKSDVLPKGYEFEINKEGNDSYLFTVYKLVSFGGFWHTFPIAPVLKDLKNLPVLRECFLDIISLLIHKCGFNAWWISYYPYDFILNDPAGFEDWFSNSHDDDDEEQKRIDEWHKWMRIQADYQSGEVHQCQKALEKRKVDIKKLHQRLDASYSKRPILAWMKQALQVIEAGFSIEYFSNESWFESDYYNDGAIRLFDQVMIIWDEDELFDIGCEMVDNEWNNFGMQEPLNHFNLFNNLKKLDFSKLKQQESWMLSVTTLNQTYQHKVIKTLVK